MVVEGRWCGKTRWLVYLEKPRFGVLVDKNIEAEQFKAHTALFIIGLAHTVIMMQVPLDS